MAIISTERLCQSVGNIATTLRSVFTPLPRQSPKVRFTLLDLLSLTSMVCIALALTRLIGAHAIFFLLPFTPSLTASLELQLGFVRPDKGFTLLQLLSVIFLLSVIVGCFLSTPFHPEFAVTAYLVGHASLLLRSRLSTTKLELRHKDDELA